MLQFVNLFNYTEKNLIQLSNKQIIKSCITLIQEKKHSHSSQKQFLGSIKKFHSECFRRDIDLSVIYPSSIRKILIKSIKKTGITKKVKVHTLRHSFATHLLENGTDVRIIQKLLGHNNLNTTMLYTQVANTTISRVKSPLDLL